MVTSVSRLRSLALLWCFELSATFSFGLVTAIVGLVVKMSALTTEHPGFEFRLRRDFSGVESYQ